MGIVIGSCMPDQPEPLERTVATSYNTGRRVVYGIKCPICAKFLLPGDLECHLVMCLTKPFLFYNEDVLREDKGECVICFEDLKQGDIIARLPCLCVYHKGNEGQEEIFWRKACCIDKWFNVNRCCPEHPGD
ncbi:hypothetical protein RUM44_003185 [Polyplax serrata]|uniref:RING-type E3 ubiquitin transferase n=1 Tax=Polyplax serrata TaxID=468196 RepID=A0ABR1AXS7_POLSC